MSPTRQNELILFAAFSFYLLIFTNSVEGSWYASIKDNKVKECVLWTQSVYDSKQEMEKMFNSKCVLNLANIHMGYLFKCGTNNNQVLFRKKEHCELFKKSLNNNIKLKKEDFYPGDIKNKDGYLAALYGCYKKAIDKITGNKKYEKTYSYCECNSIAISKHSEAELKKKYGKDLLNSTKFIKFISQIYAKCAR